jgi:hypothetical protein
MPEVWIAYAPHCPRAFQAATRAAAINLARQWAASFQRTTPSWRAMKREKWCVVKVAHHA